VDRGCWTGKVVDFIHFKEKRMDNIMPDQFEVSVGKKMTDVVFGTREKIIDTDNIRALFQKGIAEMASEKSGSSCDQDTFHRVPFL
jgi:hypothetical protein